MAIFAMWKEDFRYQEGREDSASQLSHSKATSIVESYAWNEIQITYWRTNEVCGKLPKQILASMPKNCALIFVNKRLIYLIQLINQMWIIKNVRPHIKILIRYCFFFFFSFHSNMWHGLQSVFWLCKGIRLMRKFPMNYWQHIYLLDAEVTQFGSSIFQIPFKYWCEHIHIHTNTQMSITTFPNRLMIWCFVKIVHIRVYI